MRARGSLFFATALSLGAFACGTTAPQAPGANLDAGASVDASALKDAAARDVPADHPPDVVDAGAPVFERVSAGSAGHGCAVRSDGSVWCWGLNDKGQLGIAPSASSTQCAIRGASPPRTVPCETSARRVQGLGAAADVAVGNGTSCALLRDGAVWCWGLNDAGELAQGSGTLSANPTPVRVAIPPARQLALGAFHVCAALLDGSVRCWGSNKFAQCGAPAAGPSRCDEGDGTLSPCAPTPVTVPGLSNVRSISLGRWHSCALDASGAVRCWGLNDSAQLGLGRVDAASAPVAAPSPVAIDRVTALSAGGSHTCALRDDHTLRCWGWGDLGQLGGAATTTCGAQSRPFQCGMSPVAVPALTDVRALSAGRYHTCAAGPDGVARCAGRNDNGQCGSAPSNRETCTAPPDTYPCLRAPAQAEVQGVTALSVGDYHSCAVVRDGSLRCWGWNQFGQLGDGTREDRPAAVRVLLAE